MLASSDGDTPPTPAPSQVEPAEYEALPASSSHLDVISFCIDPSAVSEGEDVGVMQAAGGSKKGVVGTITLLADGRSAMVWFGWGDLVPSSSSDGDAAAASDAGDASSTAKVVGSGVPPSMGPILLSYPSASSAAGAEPATTQLMGGESEEDMVVGHQMAARLARKVGMPVYVCSSIHSTPAPSSGGGGGGMGMVGAGMMESEAPTGFGGSLGQKAAALAEREVGRILLERKRNL